MSFERNQCMVCGEIYEYDTEAAPDFCCCVCSQGCYEAFKKGIRKED